MIDVYAWSTPNGHKVHIMMEECGFKLGRDWLAHPVNIGAGDQSQLIKVRKFPLIRIFATDNFFRCIGP